GSSADLFAVAGRFRPSIDYYGVYCSGCNRTDWSFVFQAALTSGTVWPQKSAVRIGGRSRAYFPSHAYSFVLGDRACSGHDRSSRFYDSITENCGGSGTTLERVAKTIGRDIGRRT